MEGVSNLPLLSYLRCHLDATDSVLLIVEATLRHDTVERVDESSTRKNSELITYQEERGAIGADVSHAPALEHAKPR